MLHHLEGVGPEPLDYPSRQLGSDALYRSGGEIFEHRALACRKLFFVIFDFELPSEAGVKLPSSESLYALALGKERHYSDERDQVVVGIYLADGVAVAVVLVDDPLDHALDLDKVISAGGGSKWIVH